jgi:catechol 2,3-dioxygenase-like lactoylglutathione lyase family enzyme
LAPGFLRDGTQLTYVVSDLDAALRFWTDVMKVGPFVVIEDSRLLGCHVSSGG